MKLIHRGSWDRLNRVEEKNGACKEVLRDLFVLCPRKHAETRELLCTLLP